jgi:hypothetical protein
MPEKTAYETGARKYPANHDPDPRDNFSHNVAGNKPPRNRVGLTTTSQRDERRCA